MYLKHALIPFFALTLGAAVPMMALPLQPQAYGQERGWDVPPREFNEVQRRGFHDGIEGARRDFGNHRNPTPDNRDEYRHPNVEPGVREVYREAFRRGYHEAAEHLWNAAPPPPARSDSDDWTMRGLASDAERRGYREGIEQAREDFRSRRRPDPDNHEEYRNPRVPPEVVEEFRTGFMRGYEVTMSQLSGETNWREADPDHWAMERFSEMQRRGFREGMDGARHDWDNRRRPNPANREEYREPRVPQQFWAEYREGFRRGYEVMITRLSGDR